MTPDTSPRRWHSNADPRLRDTLDTIAAHQARVATLCHSLAAAMGHALTDSDLIRAALHHDAAEAVLGDMPGPAKERFPALAAAYAKAELAVLIEMGLTWNLTRREQDMLDICDKLDAYTWARKHGATGDEWDAARGKLHWRAHTLGPAAVAWLEGALDAGQGTG
jgi:5'-deoxynucleotidase YfbR-like HD superfamily hydrolase